MKEKIIIILILCFAVVLLSVLYFNFRNNRSDQVNKNTGVVTVQEKSSQDSKIKNQIKWLEYTNEKFAFSVQYPDTFEVVENYTGVSGPNITFTHEEILSDCGCVIYVRLEDNPDHLSIDDWLNAQVKKGHEYISQEEFDRRKNSSDETERIFAGKYSEEETTVAAIPALKQNYGTEGGGYERILFRFLGKMYVITAGSDGYYFNSVEYRRDNGELYEIYLKMVDTFSPLSYALVDASGKVNYEPTVDMNVKKWKQYTKPDWGLAFRYPNEFAVYPDSTRQISMTRSNLIGADSGIPIIHILREKTDATDIEDWMRQKESPESFTDVSVSRLPGKQFEKPDTGGGAFQATYVFSNGYVYSFVVGAFFDYELLDVYDGILSTVEIEE